MTFPSVLDLSTLDGTNGFFIYNSVGSRGDYLGWSVSSAGDVNNDGIDDLIVGARGVDTGAGQSYVVFGSSSLGNSFDVSNLDGTNGFAINGIAGFNQLGFSVSSAGDINNDGYADLIVGAQAANNNMGASYVVFGSGDPFSSSLDVSTLDGSDGFAINGIAVSGQLGWSVSSAGDVNNDGYDDLIVGAPGASNTSYVVFGSGDPFSSSFDLSSLDGNNGFVIESIDGGNFGRSVSSAGDVNNDGYDDLIVGAPGVNGNAGASYIVFGSSSFNPSFDVSTLDGSNGFAINGLATGDVLGVSVSSAGDVNNDGYDDLIVGAQAANGGKGASYVVFGSGDPFSASFDLSSLDGSNGFAINGIAVGDYSGYSVSSAGDLNGDDIDDLIIGAPAANGYAGEGYVIFGSEDAFSASFDLSTLDGSNGFVIQGINSSDLSHLSISGAGDVNGDGVADLIIGAPYADGGVAFGKSYVVYGVAAVTNQPPFARNDSATTAQDTAVDVLVLANDSDPDGDPLAIDSFTQGANGSVALNDNGTPGDATDDYLVYTPNAGIGGQQDSFTYTISDGTDTATATVTVEIGANITGTNGDDPLNGTPGNDDLYGENGKDTINGFDGDDTLSGGNGKDLLIGGTGNDVLSGQGNDENSPDTLIGVDPNSLNPGVNEIDILTGGGGPDTFVLGDANSVYYNDFDYYYSFETNTGYVGKGQFNYAGNPEVVLESGAGPTNYLQFLSLSVFDPANNLLDSGNSVVDGISSDGYLLFEFDTGTETLSGLDNNTEASGSDPYYFVSNAVDPDYNFVGAGNTDFNLFAFSPQTPGTADFLGYADDILIAPGNGDDDYALITDFTPQDKIQLKGTAADYVLDGNYTLGGSTGTAIFLNETVNDFIAFVQGVTGLDLNSNAFSFV